MSKEKTLMVLFWPIFLETLFHMLAGIIDTLMLSGLNDYAVGAVGTSNTYLSIFVIMFSIISSGMVAVMTQYIGAGKKYVAKQAKNIGLILNGALSIILSLIFVFFTKNILLIMGIANNLLDYATTYMTIVGGASILTGLIPVYSNYLRSFGHTKVTMVTTMLCNILNLLLNGLFLFVFHKGVAGIAIATVISKVINLLAIMLYAEKKIIFNKIQSDISNKLILKQIIKIGIPAATESALYNLSMAFVMKFLNQMDSDGLNVTALSYVTTITNFSYCAGLAFASANSIILGWNIGNHKYNEGYKGTFKALKYGLITCISSSIFFIIFGKNILGVFTDNQTLISTCHKLLILDILLQSGRIMNLVFANALKTAADALYIVVVASISMLLVCAGGTYLFGVQLNLLVFGAYISMTLDELIRGFIALNRFISRKWEKKSLV